MLVPPPEEKLVVVDAPQGASAQPPVKKPVPDTPVGSTGTKTVSVRTRAPASSDARGPDRAHPPSSTTGRPAGGGRARTAYCPAPRDKKPQANAQGPRAPVQPKRKWDSPKSFKQGSR